MMTGGHVRLLEAVPASSQNIDVDAVVDQEERSQVDFRRQSWRANGSWRTLSACCDRSRPDPAINGSAWLHGSLVGTDGIAVSVAVGTGLRKRDKLFVFLFPHRFVRPDSHTGS